MDSKIALGLVLLTVSSVMLFALAGIGVDLPFVLGGIGVLGLAAGSLLVGTSVEGRAV